MPRALHLGLVLSVLGSAASGQTAPEPPLWAYLAECGAVFEAVAATGDNRGAATGPEVERAAEAAMRFVAQAETAAGAAGQADPSGDVASILLYLRPRWQNRVAGLFSAPSNFDWIAYCGRLGRAEGVLPLPPG